MHKIMFYRKIITHSNDVMKTFQREKVCIWCKPTWHDHLVAALAAIAILSGATLATHYLPIIPSTECLTGQ